MRNYAVCVPGIGKHIIAPLIDCQHWCSLTICEVLKVKVPFWLFKIYDNLYNNDTNKRIINAPFINRCSPSFGSRFFLMINRLLCQLKRDGIFRRACSINHGFSKIYRRLFYFPFFLFIVLLPKICP